MLCYSCQVINHFQLKTNSVMKRWRDDGVSHMVCEFHEMLLDVGIFEILTYGDLVQKENIIFQYFYAIMKPVFGSYYQLDDNIVFSIIWRTINHFF